MPKTKKEQQEEKGKVTLTKEQILTMMKSRPKNVSKEEFDRYIRPCGSSGHIGVSKAWVGKYAHVTIEEVKE